MQLEDENYFSQGLEQLYLKFLIYQCYRCAKQLISRLIFYEYVVHKDVTYDIIEHFTQKKRETYIKM